MKNQGNLMGGWILLGFGLLSVVFTTVITIVLFQVSRRMEGLTMPIYLFPLLAGVLVALIFIGTGLFMVNKGMKSRRIMQTGKKAECRVHNVLRVKKLSTRGDLPRGFRQRTHALALHQIPRCVAS